MISVSEAMREILACIPSSPISELCLSEYYPAVLREPLVADRPFPPFDRVAMDGIALAHKTWQGGQRAFKVEAQQPAGTPAHTLHSELHCIEVMTGAVLPRGCDCVVKIEDLDLHEGRAHLKPDIKLQPRQNIHSQGSDYQTGEVLAKPGSILRAHHYAIAASVGKTSIKVSRLPRIALVSTGDELVQPSRSPLPHQIRSSNQSFFASALFQAHLAETENFHLPDSAPALESGLSSILAEFDMLIISGGVSMGLYDLVPGTLAKLGVRKIFHKVAQKPGKPLWFGVSQAGLPIFALPGNPVSAAICLYRYVFPALFQSLNRSPYPLSALLNQTVRFSKSLTQFLPVKLCQNESAQWLADPVKINGSGDFATLAKSDGFLELPAQPEVFEKGCAYPLWLWQV